MKRRRINIKIATGIYVSFGWTIRNDQSATRRRRLINETRVERLFLEGNFGRSGTILDKDDFAVQKISIGYGVRGF